MKRSMRDIIIFVISAVCFSVRTKLIYNTGYFCDEHNLSPDIIYGGNFYSILDWIEWGLLLIICLISLISLILSVVKYRKKQN